MNSFRKRKLLDYLYPTEEILEFMYFDFYPELTLFLDRKICFSAQNNKQSIRKENLKIANSIIKNFLIKNINYYNKFIELFPNRDINIIISNILYGYVLNISSNINKGNGADIFLDKRSVCYSNTSIIDLL